MAHEPEAEASYRRPDDNTELKVTMSTRYKQSVKQRLYTFQWGTIKKAL